MRINKKLIKKVKFDEKQNNIIKINGIAPFSIMTTLSYDRIDQFKDCLYYMNKCDGINLCEIVVVVYENEFKDLDFSEFQNCKIKLIRSGRNNPDGVFCLSHARNIGLKNCKNEWVLCLDADIILPSNICRLLSSRRNDNNIYGTVRLNVKENNKFELDVLEKKIISIDDSFYGFFHFFNKNKIMNLVGGYDECMIGWGREDCCLIMRCQMSKMKIVVLPQIKLYHVIHDYDELNWRIKGSDDRNHSIQITNRNLKKIKMENIGNIISINNENQ